jgi:hypothetical protein
MNNEPETTRSLGFSLDDLIIRIREVCHVEADIDRQLFREAEGLARDYLRGLYADGIPT